MYGLGIIKGLGVTIKNFFVSYKDDIAWLGRGGRYYNEEAFLQRQSLDGEGIIDYLLSGRKTAVSGTFSFCPVFGHGRTAPGTEVGA